METARTPGFVAWPEKLITQAEAFVLAAAWPVRAELRWQPMDIPAMITVPGPSELGPWTIVLCCAKDGCGQSCGQLARGTVAYNGSLDEMLSMVLRHMVMAHDVALSGLRASPKVDES
jgi:hypothetical protein